VILLSEIWNNMKNTIMKVVKGLRLGLQQVSDPITQSTESLTHRELAKTPTRSAVINYLIKTLNRSTLYLEVGVRDPADNFDLIVAEKKYSVDPGVEFKRNPVDFGMTSDEFFHQLDLSNVLDTSVRFDVIFIDGLHLADQVHRDIQNALRYLAVDGFIIMHDCNPPTEWHARETYQYLLGPAGGCWNGTTWKAYYKMRFDPCVSCYCVDTDWGVGVITRRKWGSTTLEHDENPYLEFQVMSAARTQHLNLISFAELQMLFQQEQKHG
jgi:hypothetical protein